MVEKMQRLKKDEKKQRYVGARKSLIQEDILVQENI